MKTLDTHLHHSLSRRVFYRWLIPTLLEWVVIVALFWIGFAAHYWLVWVFVIIVLGSRQQALGLLGHDGAHFTAAKNKRLNDSASALLCFWPMLTTLADYRGFHLRHHRLLNTEEDPEVIFKTQMSSKQWNLPASRMQILAYFLFDLLGFGIHGTMEGAQAASDVCRTEGDTKRRMVLSESGSHSYCSVV